METIFDKKNCEDMARKYIAWSRITICPKKLSQTPYTGRKMWKNIPKFNKMLQKVGTEWLKWSLNYLNECNGKEKVQIYWQMKKINPKLFWYVLNICFRWVTWGFKIFTKGNNPLGLYIRVLIKAEHCLLKDIEWPPHNQ